MAAHAGGMPVPEGAFPDSLENSVATQSHPLVSQEANLLEFVFLELWRVWKVLLDFWDKNPNLETRASLELTMWPRLILNFWFSCYHLSPGTRDVNHHASYTWVLFFLFNATSLHFLQNVQTLSFLCTLCLWGRGYMHMCGCAHAHLCACKQRPEDTSALILRCHPLFFFLRQILSPAQNLSSRSDWVWNMRSSP